MSVTREDVRAFINKMESSIEANPYSIIYRKIEGFPTGNLCRGNRGCDRFITAWKQEMIGEYGVETFSGFMDDFGSWIPF